MVKRFGLSDQTTESFQNTPDSIHTCTCDWLSPETGITTRQISHNGSSSVEQGRAMRHCMSTDPCATPHHKSFNAKTKVVRFRLNLQDKTSLLSPDCSHLTSCKQSQSHRLLMVIHIKDHMLFPFNCCLLFMQKDLCVIRTDKHILLTFHSRILSWFSAQCSPHSRIRFFFTTACLLPASH